MTIYTDNKVINKRAAMVLNLQGGCAIEIVSPTCFEASKASVEHQLGDLGIYIGQIKTANVEKTYAHFKSMDGHILAPITKNPEGKSTFYIQEPNGLIYQVISGNSWFTKGKHVTGGIQGCTIGVSDIDASMKLYSDLLGYDKVVYDKSGSFDDWKGLPGGEGKYRRVLLSQKKPSGGGFTKLSGHTYIELVQDLSDRTPVKIFEDRKWGDIGFVHLGFDVRDMGSLEEKLTEKGFGFTCDTKNVLSMGDNTRVHCVYIEDPDGTLLELIEVYKIPIIEKLGITLNVNKRPASKPLPNFLLKALSLNRVKD